MFKHPRFFFRRARRWRILGLDCRRSNGVCLAFGVKLVLALKRVPLPPNAQDHGPFEPKLGHHLRRLLLDAKKNDFFDTALIFNREQ